MIAGKLTFAAKADSGNGAGTARPRKFSSLSIAQGTSRPRPAVFAFADRPWIAVLILLHTAIGAPAQPAYVIESKNFRVPDLGLAFNLPKEWTDLGKERIDTMNRLTRERTPQEKGRYVAGLERDLSYSRRSGYPTYIFIQKYPSKVSAKSLLAAFPKLRKQGSREAALGDPYLDEKLRVVVAASVGTGEEGPFTTRTYTVPTKTNLVNIYAYCKVASATTVIPELESALLSLKIDEPLKLPDKWVEDLKSLMRVRDFKATPVARTNTPAATLPATNSPAPSGTPGTNEQKDEFKTTPAGQTNTPPAAPPGTNTPAPSGG